MTQAPSNKLTLSQKLAFATPGITIAWLIPPMYAILADFYLRYTAATAAGVGTAMIVSKVIDAITDPPVGYLSDHTKTRMGARKPWIIAGTLLSMFTFWVFFNPPDGAGNAYFATGIILYYLAYTLIKIPYRSWLGEITPSYGERSQTWSYFTIALLVGGLLIMVIPILLSSPLMPIFETAEFDKDMISLIGWVGIVGMPIAVAVALLGAPQGTRNPGMPPTVKGFLDILRTCKPYQVFMYGYGASALGFGVFYSVIIVALTSYFGFADRIPLFLLFMIVAQVASIPIWERIGARYSKHRTWGAAWAAHAVLGPFVLFFGQNTPHFELFVAYGCITAILQGPHMLFPVAIVNDIVDYDTLQSGKSRSGNFMSVYTLIDKILHAIGYGIGFYIIAIFGYDPKAEVHGLWETVGLMTAIVVVPSLLFAVSAFFLFRFPIDKEQHTEIRTRLDRMDREGGWDNAADAASGAVAVSMQSHSPS